MLVRRSNRFLLKACLPLLECVALLFDAGLPDSRESCSKR
jgi:hypothetical protein